MSDTRTRFIEVTPTICTCGLSSPNVVTVYQGVTEHHCLPPQPCWNTHRRDPEMDE